MSKYQTAERAQQELGISLDISSVLQGDFFTEKEYQNIKTAVIKLANSYLVKKERKL